MKKKLLYLTLVAVIATATVLYLARPSGNAAAKTATTSKRLGTASADPDKETQHARMQELQNVIESLLEQMGHNPDDKTLRPQIDEAQAEFDVISNDLGGDKPFLKDNGSAARVNLPQVVAPVPIGCPTASATFSATPNLRIPASGTGGLLSTPITSTITVTGAGTYLWDLDLVTNITHTASSDLDITLRSPAGTIVTITTDNGGPNDNVFNGTRWDDQAGTAVSDSAFANNVVLTTAVPEEAMGAFIGEDPNGVWTITIHDDALFDSGNLASWSLEVATLSQAPFATTVSGSNNTPAQISNTCVGGPVIQTIPISGLGLFTGRVRLTTHLQHANPADIDMTLTSPAGTVVTLTTDNGLLLNVNPFDGTVWDDKADPGTQVPYLINQGLVTDRLYLLTGAAATLVPEEAMAAFNGENPNGNWTLTIVDDSCNLLTGTLNSWSLEVTSVTCCQISCPANIAQGNDLGQCGKTVTFSPTSTNCAVVTCSPPSGSFFPLGTTTVTCTTTAGPGCSFTVTITDTQPPSITCPTNIVAVATPSCPAGTATTASYTAPTATDNCPGVTVACVPPSGSSFPAGTTTVTCTATDASGNTATCSFSVKVFNVAIQDRANPNAVLAWNTSTGEYIFCCNGTTYNGIGKVKTQGCTYTLDHTAADRRVIGSVNMTNFTGSGSLQAPAGTTKCTISDSDVRNNTYTCLGSAPPPMATSK